jgi:hypothetical protein
MVSVDFQKYETLLRAVASMSRLYSDSSKPYINPRFVEKLFVYTSTALDFSRRDMSFDAKTTSGAGVGIKTFVAPSFTSGKTEKIAEFTRDATRGQFKDLSQDELAYKVAELRNARVLSDARVYEVDMGASFYHCLVRSANAAQIHEEPYSPIDLDKFKLTSGKTESGNPKFTDGQSSYTFSIAKNTLFKTFELAKYQNSARIPVSYIDDIFEQLLLGSVGPNLVDPRESIQIQEEPKEGLLSVVLPLYSTRTQKVEEKSGINQWNAGGRDREFGEAYIPHPKEVRKAFPNFFPPRDEPFTLRMPDGSEMSAKVCQADGKAIMSKPNKDLMGWLFKLIDDSPSSSEARLRNGVPYTMDDLIRVGKDSVRFTLVDEEKRIYEMEPMAIGSFSDFMSQLGEEEQED